MDPHRIAELLRPFLQHGLSSHKLGDISTYIDLLEKWNRRINLTAVRNVDEMVTRHFGESLFAAQHLFPSGSARKRLVDIGSGAGFPGLPIKIWVPDISLVLIEANQKKAVFLREVVRALALSDVEVFDRRADDFKGHAEVITLRAVESFQSVLPIAARFLGPDGRLALLIGAKQVSMARAAVPTVAWDQEIPIPLSKSRVIQVGKHTVAVEPR